MSVGARSENEVDLANLTTMTAAWSPGTVALPCDGLDVDGNCKVDRADLAILAGNYAPAAVVDADTRLMPATFCSGWRPTATVSHRVDGFVGNPTVTAGNFPGQPTSGDPDVATLMHAQRATMQWIP